MDELTIDGLKYKGVMAQTTKATLLMIKGSQGILGCGYFDIPTCEKLGEAAAVVTGVSTYEHMLDAEVVRVSKPAEALGVKLGMRGREALKLLA